MLNSAVFNFAGKSQILRFIYHKLDITTQIEIISENLVLVVITIGLVLAVKKQ